MVLGDFNLPEIQWKPRPSEGALPTLQKNTLRGTRFIDHCDVLGLNQYVTLPTRLTNVLDLVLARGVDEVCANPRNSVIASDHDEIVVSCVVNTAAQPVRVTRSTALNYRRADFDGLRHALSVTP